MNAGELHDSIVPFLFTHNYINSSLSIFPGSWSFSIHTHLLDSSEGSR